MFTQHYNPLIIVFLFPLQFRHIPCHSTINQIRPLQSPEQCTHTHTVQCAGPAEAANDHNSLQTATNGQPRSEPRSKPASGASAAPVLHRVKRKGIGSFFGARSKATPNTWDPSMAPGQIPYYGNSGSVQNFGGRGGNYNQEESLYYLIVAAISFGVVVYCCYQCNSQTRGDGLEAYRARHLESARERHQRLQQQNAAGDSSLFNGGLNGQSIADNEIDQFKASAPPLTPLVQDADRYRTTTTMTTTMTNETASQLPTYPPTNAVNYANGGLYPTDQPPSYEQAIQLDARRPTTGQPQQL